MVEAEVRAAFARHEHLTPPVEPVRASIETATVRRRRRRLAARAAGVVLLMLAVAVPGYGFTWAAGRNEPIASGELFPDRGVRGRALNILLLGVDAGQKDAGRADLVLIAHIPADRRQAYLLSLPRDLLISVPSDRVSGYRGGTDKLSAAFYHGSLRPGGAADLAGGAKLVEATLARLTGLTFDGVVTVRYAALRAVTDHVGGVRMCLENPVTSFHTGHRFPAGCQRLDGRNALDLLRQRGDLPGDALDRDRHGRDYLKALLAVVRADGTLEDPMRVNNLLLAAKGGLVVDAHGGDKVSLLIAGSGIGADDVVGMAAPVVSRSDGTIRLADSPATKALFQAYAGDRVTAWVADNPSAID